MRLAAFLAKFDQLADEPESVARLRELVLDLAMTGRLAPLEGEWAKHPLRSLATKIGSGATPAGGRASYFSEGIPLIRSMNVHFRGFNRTGLVFLSDAQADQLSNVTVEPDDVLLNITGASIGRVTTAPPEMAGARVNQHVTIIRSTPELTPAFLAMFLASPSVQRMINDIQVGATRQALTKGMIEEFEIPLPSIGEQKRIVAKVDELMALCDRLESQLQERETRHAALASASLARFAEAPTPADLEFLFHPAYAIAPTDLRKSILTLAAQGKLVPQDPNDEPAAELVERVASALPNKKSENPFLGEIGTSITEESEFELPPGWVWLPLGHVGIWATGCGFPIQYQGETNKEFLFCKVSDMNLPGNEVEIHATIHSIDADVMKKIRARANPVGTIIFPKIGGAIATHKRRLVVKPTIIDNNCSGIQPIGLTDDRWLLLFMRNLDLTKYQSGTSVPAVSQGSLDPIRIGLPPLPEQRRIVAKVDQLLALVDKLETQLAASRATAQKLLAALVAELTAKE